jgi:hypothetical protein
MSQLILPSYIIAERQTLEAARTQAQQKDPNALSRVATWKTRIIDALSSHNATFVTATLQLQKVSDAYGKGLTTEGASQAQIKKAKDAEKAFMEYKPEGGKLSIQELIETLVRRAQTTYSETARGLSKSYIASVIKDKDNISNQEIHTLLTELVAERGPKVQDSRLEIITNADLLIAQLQGTSLENWFDVISSNANRETAIQLIEKNARAINALVVDNDNPSIGNTLSFGHMPVSVEAVLDAKGKPTETSTRPLQELQLAALLSYMVRKSFVDTNQQSLIQQFENEGIPLLDASQLKNMSLHNIDFRSNPDLAVFTFAVAYLLGISPGLGDCRVCDLINPVSRLPDPGTITGFLRVITQNPGIAVKIDRLFGVENGSFNQQLASVQERLKEAQV